MIARKIEIFCFFFGAFMRTGSIDQFDFAKLS